MARTRMRFKKRSLTFGLGAVDIDRASEWLSTCLVEVDAERADRLRMRLLFEEALLNMAEHYGVDQEVSAYLEKRRGRCRLRIVAKAPRFNPLEPEMEMGQDELSTSLFSIIDLHVQYVYSMGANVLRMSLPRPTVNPVLIIGIALLAGAMAGVLGNILIPDVVEESISNAILHPIADMWVRLLQAISGPIIFLTALMATFGTKRIADFGGSRIATVARYFAISALVTLFSLLCALQFFPLEVTATEAYDVVLSNMLDGALQVVPGNLMEPFITANTLQLLLIAVVTGYLLALLDSSIGELKTIIQQLNILAATVARYTCSLVPFFVGLLLCLKIWTHDVDLLGAIWAPLVLAAALSAIVLLAVLVVVSMRFKVSPLLLARKLKKPFIDALKKGTIDFSNIDDLASSCKQLLGIHRGFARASLPQGLFLYMPTGAIGLCVFVLFAAQTQHLAVDAMWFVSAAVLFVVLAVATPPVTGANLLSFVMAFSYLGISSDAFLDVMVFDIVFGVLCVAVDQAMLQIETINQAERMGFLDEEALRAPLPES